MPTDAEPLPRPPTRLQVAAVTFAHYYPGATLANLAAHCGLSLTATATLAGVLEVDGYLMAAGPGQWMSTGAWSPEDDASDERLVREHSQDRDLDEDRVLAELMGAPPYAEGADLEALRRERAAG